MKTSLENVWFLILLALAIGVAFAAGLKLIPLWSATVAVLVVGAAELVISFVRLPRRTAAAARPRDNAAHLETLIAHLDEAILGYDENFTVTLMNPRAEELFGIPRESAIGVAVAPSRASDKQFRLLAQVLFPSLAPSVVKKSGPGEEPQVLEMSFDNPKRDLTVVTLKTEGESGGAFIKILRDRTRETGLIEGKSEFVSTAAHELRTPLTGMNWALETLAGDAALSAESRELAVGALESGKKLLKIVNDLLDVSQIEEGRFGYAFRDVDLGDLVENLLGAAMPAARQYGIHIYMDKAAGALAVKADETRLGMAISNIIDNAMKYNVKGGEVRVSVSRKERRAEVVIKDTGIGIPEEERAEVFEKFNRGSNAAKLTAEGTGLGLYIAKNIVEQHGGTISFESELNRGTTFHIVLPLIA